MITLTPAAAQRLHAAFEDNAEDDVALRIAARLADDGSLEIGMGFDDQRDGDLAFDDKGIAMLVGKPSQELLMGTVLDYLEVAPGSFRFVFAPATEDDAPPASGGTCGSGGCGKCGGAG